MKPSFACFPSCFLLAFFTALPFLSCTQDLAADSVKSSYFNYHYNSLFLNEPYYVLKELGAPVNTVTYRKLTSNYGINAYDHLFTLPDADRDSAYSYIRYLKGSKQEEGFTAGFSQRLFKQFVLEADFRSLNSPGFFINQTSKIRNYHAGLSFQSKDGMYQAGASYSPAKVDAKQNGGIRSDSLLSSISNNEGKALAVNLDSDGLIFRNKRLRFNQQMQFAPAADSGKIKEFSFSLRHEGHYKREHFQYNSTDINSDFYINSFIDTTLTNDSSAFSSFYNSIAAILELKIQGGLLKLAPSYGAEFIQYNLPEFHLSSVTHSGGLKSIWSANDYSILADYTLKRNAFHENGHTAELTLILDELSALNEVKLSITNASVFPSLLSEHYFSNHFIWNNNFNNIIKTGFLLSTSLFKNKVSFKTGYQILDNHIYYDVLARPKQFNGNINTVTIVGEFNIPVYHSLKAYSKIKFESADREEVYRVPEFYTYSALYIERPLFKNALLTSFGAGVLYFSDYRADAFMPATAQFYLQNETTVGNYPYLDVFLNFQIKSAKFFVRVEHINWRQGDDYFYLPHHPTPGRTLKVGLSWTFNELQVSKR